MWEFARGNATVTNRVLIRELKKRVPPYQTICAYSLPHLGIKINDLSHKDRGRLVYFYSVSCDNLASILRDQNSRIKDFIKEWEGDGHEEMTTKDISQRLHSLLPNNITLPGSET